MVLAGVWFLMWFGMKRAKKIETPLEILQHALPVMLGFWLLFARDSEWPKGEFPPGSGAVWWIGLALTAAGIGISIWGRFTLGANWSSTVTLKHGHELIRAGLYPRMRHPIYSGILLGMIGTAII
ncbi:MAG TPA: isoprenylcysteine carboxylmethyltransferase family protein [Candidatus Limnocylindrales bacterium]|nr:isoprenylcysteine carboxylmethyltransferase family protein [Candidatus Limnocylindrales bacterium]